MTRLEENKILIEKVTERVESKPKGTYEEIVTLQLGMIATMLADISKSLAVIACKAERKVNDIRSSDKEESI